MISIIGAGPAGSYSAYLLAKEGYKVNVYEEHSEIGKPVQCTGIVTSIIREIIKEEDSFVTNKINEVDVFSPNGNRVTFKLAHPNPILDRAKFDLFLAEKAQSEGAKIFLKSKFGGMEHKGGIKIKINNKIGKTDALIGADGPQSAVAKSSGLFCERKFVIGHQARVKIDCNPETVEFWLGIGQFAWVVPEPNNIARIGVLGEKDVHGLFEKFIKIKSLSKESIIEYQSGIIPVYSPKQKTYSDNVYLVGDAACMVKPTTYGGIIQGLMAAECLQESIKEKKDYEHLWKSRMGRDLRIGLLMRKVMNKFSPEDYNKLIGMCSSDKVRKVLETTDRDYASKILFKLLLANPKFLRFSKKLFWS